MKAKSLLILALVFLTVSAVRAERPVDARTLRVINHGWWSGGIAQCPEALTPFSRLPYAYKDPESSLLASGWAFSTTSGVGVRFATNSKSIGVRYTLTSNPYMANMTPIGSKGIDLYFYSDEAQRWLYAASHKPTNSTAQESVIHGDFDGSMREYILYLPSYDSVKNLEVLIDDDATITTGRAALPDRRYRIVGYGSSIFQGASASRTGLLPSAMIGRNLGCEFINMGISGSAQMHPEVARALADIPDVDVYVLDPLPNCLPWHVENVAPYFIDTLRKAHPHAHIVMVEMPPVPAIYFSALDSDKYTNINPAWRALYEKYAAADPEHLHYMPAAEIYGDYCEYTADQIHYTDYGFHLYTEALTKILKPLVQFDGDYSPRMPALLHPGGDVRLHGYHFMSIEPVPTASGYTIEVSADSTFVHDVWHSSDIGPFDTLTPWRAREIVLADTTLNGATDYYARLRADYIGADGAAAATEWCVPVPFRYLPPFPGGEHWLEDNAIAGVEPSGALQLVNIDTEDYEPVQAGRVYTAICGADTTFIAITGEGNAFDKKEYRIGPYVYTPALADGCFEPFARSMVRNLVCSGSARRFEPVEMMLNKQYIGLYFRTDTIVPASAPADSLLEALTDADIYTRGWEQMCSTDSLARQCVADAFLGDDFAIADALRFPRFVKAVQNIYNDVLLQDPDGLLSNIDSFAAQIQDAEAQNNLLWDYYAAEPLSERLNAAKQRFVASLDTLDKRWGDKLTAHLNAEVIIDEPELAGADPQSDSDADTDIEEEPNPDVPAITLFGHDYADGIDIFRGTDVQGYLSIPFGYEAVAFYVNGDDRTDVLNADGTFALHVVDTDTRIEAEVRKIDTGIGTLSTAEGRLAATVDSYGRVSVNRDVELLTAGGMLIARDNNFQLPQHGVYMLRSGVQTLKITW